MLLGIKDKGKPSKKGPQIKSVWIQKNNIYFSGMFYFAADITESKII